MNYEYWLDISVVWLLSLFPMALYYLLLAICNKINYFRSHKKEICVFVFVLKMCNAYMRQFHCKYLHLMPNRLAKISARSLQ